LSGSFSNTGTTSTTGAVNPFQTIDRKDVGLTLGVTPQINADNHVKLKLNLEVSGIASGTAGSANLITNKRTLTNTVGIENGQILVIGGLIQDQITDTKNGVPFLSSIPLIGALFQYRSISKTKQNLMLFIRPSILRKQSDGDYYTRRKYDAVRQAQINAVAVPGGDRPVLESFDKYIQSVAPPSPSTEKTAPITVQPPLTQPPGAITPAPAPAAPADNSQPVDNNQPEQSSTPDSGKQ
jgi:general secretion pathway protein D